ncbi:MAG: phosphoribosylformylglycinamidine synthase [bacterium]|nr:phosphoribosylformylglycinamidine synthase [bacterium]
MTFLRGEVALSQRRAALLLDALRRSLPLLQPHTLTARYLYCLEHTEAFSNEVFSKVCALLRAEPASHPHDGFIVIPRKGTISPWASKATDIFHNCGLQLVTRVERGIHYRIICADQTCATPAALRSALHLLHDRMTEGVYEDISDLFFHPPSPPHREIDVLTHGMAALEEANRPYGLALNHQEMQYLLDTCQRLHRNLTDVELVMFGQVNSEHCRHKIFNARWRIDGLEQPFSLFEMIRTTHARHPHATRVAYEDNAAVVEGWHDIRLEVAHDLDNIHVYREQPTLLDVIMKVETHNHPTAIAPYPGAATGTGGEIRDESATGTGGKSVAGLCGFMVSHLRVPGFLMPWEQDYAEFPHRLATPLQIMLEGPLGSANYGNEFGRPQITGLFRTCELVYNGRYRGYHKPIMVAGGVGLIKREHSRKKPLPPGALIVQIGGPALRIGLGGGAASSMATGSNVADLDFDSVQRDNAEMERRCQEVIDACCALGADNPILSIHDIGAGGLSNGCPELVAKTGGRFYLRRVPNQDSSMSPMEIWCCEAQERYVLAIAPESQARFLALCARERCPVAIIGEVTGDGRLTLLDELFQTTPIDLDIGVILGKPPRLLRDVSHRHETHAPLNLNGVTIEEAVQRVLRFPAVANKTFLISIGDRSVSGLIARDQMVGPYQTPIADYGLTLASYSSYHGTAMAMGERTPLALVNAPASGRIAIGEALLNIASAAPGSLSRVKLSANWMCACGEEGEDALLYDTVRAVALEFCPALGISIPVGKDSLSMRTVWQTSHGTPQRMIAPLSLIVSAFAPVDDVRLAVTPELKPVPSRLLLLDLGRGRNRLGCSALAQVFNQLGNDPPDVDDPTLLARAFAAMQELLTRRLLLACHDRSDGGLFVTVAEMAIAARMGARISLDSLGSDDFAALFSEELGLVLQIAEDQYDPVLSVLTAHGLSEITHTLGAPTTDRTLAFSRHARPVYREQVSTLAQWWSELTHHMQCLRDNGSVVQDEFLALRDENDPGMQCHLTYDPHAPFVSTGARPRIAILREQGINGHVEMAACFHRAGFECHDVHMTDLLTRRVSLDAMVGLVACGGFSYGDVLGAGAGWARTILFNDLLKEMFTRFFARPDTFALGVCNGCQMMALLKDIIPGAEHWPYFTRNLCERFEARYVTVEILPSPSIFFTDMVGSRLPVPVAHGEGYANFTLTGSRATSEQEQLVALRYVDNYGAPTERYPFNPNGSPGGITGLCSRDGRVTIMMPHPERLFRKVQMSYCPPQYPDGEAGPWLRMFQNARRFVG